MSKGEDRIVDLLKEEGIKFVREKSFQDLRGGLFRYDFYLPYVDGGPAIIEYNGEQHYHFVKKFFKKRADLQKVQEHDRRKIRYALANDIPIYIIPYWELSKIQHGRQLIQECYRAKDQWKNDDDFDKFQHEKE